MPVSTLVDWKARAIESYQEQKADRVRAEKLRLAEHADRVRTRLCDLLGVSPEEVKQVEFGRVELDGVVFDYRNEGPGWHLCIVAREGDNGTVFWQADHLDRIGEMLANGRYRRP
ncbi:MAG: hypothetical protein NUW01_14260 [Gemmatimonadaceae bacterium]|nr:hypothetical protein [Gemmatimonadaceae bacterium]